MTVNEVSAPSHETPSPWRIMWREIYADKLALVSLFVFITIVIVSYVWASFYSPEDLVRVYLARINRPPGGDFPLGTDPGGRDMVAMLVVGARNSFTVAFTVAIMTSVIGLLIGLFSGFYGGHVDNVVMRIVDFFSMVPTLMLIIVIIVLIPNFTPIHLGLIFVIFGWVGMARVMRLKTLQHGVMDYVQASKTLGTPNLVIIFREVLPNIISFTVVNLTLGIASTMGIETGLTFLGFGLPPGYPSLGTLISYARAPIVLQERLWQWLPAALLIFGLMLCINFVGQALNRAADAKRRNV